MAMRIPNTFGLNVSADQVVSFDSVESLLTEYRKTKESGKPFLVLGEGSNSLFTDDFSGTVALNRIKGIAITEDDDAYYLSVGAGEIWHNLVEYTIHNQLPGLENLALIPGCVGSAPIQNIGAYGVEFKQFAHYVKLLDLESGEILTVEDGEYGYRESIFKKEYRVGFIVVEVGLRLSKQWTPTLSYGELKAFQDDSEITAQQIFNKVCEIRRSKLPNPSEIGNAGSFYKNPVIEKGLANMLLIDHPTMPIYPQKNGEVKVAAGWLIDQCGFKGHHVGGASVYEKQALILINRGDATPQDILTLSAQIQLEVKKKFGIGLEPEVRFIPETAK